MSSKARQNPPKSNAAEFWKLNTSQSLGDGAEFDESSFNDTELERDHTDNPLNLSFKGNAANRGTATSSSQTTDSKGTTSTSKGNTKTSTSGSSASSSKATAATQAKSSSLGSNTPDKANTTPSKTQKTSQTTSKPSPSASARKKSTKRATSAQDASKRDMDSDDDESEEDTSSSSTGAEKAKKSQTSKKSASAKKAAPYDSESDDESDVEDPNSKNGATSSSRAKNVSSPPTTPKSAKKSGRVGAKASGVGKSKPGSRLNLNSEILKSIATGRNVKAVDRSRFQDQSFESIDGEMDSLDWSETVSEIPTTAFTPRSTSLAPEVMRQRTPGSKVPEDVEESEDTFKSIPGPSTPGWTATTPSSIPAPRLSEVTFSAEGAAYMDKYGDEDSNRNDNFAFQVDESDADDHDSGGMQLYDEPYEPGPMDEVEDEKDEISEDEPAPRKRRSPAPRSSARKASEPKRDVFAVPTPLAQASKRATAARQEITHSDPGALGVHLPAGQYVFEEVKSPIVNGRPLRKRIRPVDFYRNEKVIYGFRDDSKLPTVLGVIRNLAPDATSYGAPHPKRPKRVNEEDLNVDPIESMPVLDLATGVTTDRVVAIPKPEFKPIVEGDPKSQIAEAFGGVTGWIKIANLSDQEFNPDPDQSKVFFVLRGSVIFQMGNAKTRVPQYGSFLVPPNTSFSIRHGSAQNAPCLLSFVALIGDQLPSSEYETEES